VEGGVAGAGDGDGDVPPDDPGVLPGVADEPGAGAGACAACALLVEALPPHDVIISVEKPRTITKLAADKNLCNIFLLGDLQVSGQSKGHTCACLPGEDLKSETNTLWPVLHESE
jgi:hypothetical protein